MEPLKTRIRTNLIYGAIALLPFAALIYILVQLFGFLKTLSEPLISFLGTDTNLYLNMALLIFFTIFTWLAICYFIGALINTQIGARTFKKEASFLSDMIPGFEILINLARGFTGNKQSYPPALITLFAPGTAVLGYVMEDEGDAYLTVYVPTAPIMTAGAIHMVERSRVQLIEGSSGGAANCVTQWGLGLKKFRGAAQPPKIP